MENTCGTTFVDYFTSFEIQILEAGWIDNVHLLLSTNIQNSIKNNNFNDIRSEKALHCCRKEINGCMYSKFTCIISFSKPISYMEYCFSYSINGYSYLTEPQCFTVI